MSRAAPHALPGSARHDSLRWRWPLAAAAALAVIALLLPFTAKPVAWDELVYMGLAFHPEPKAWVLNRWAHIYALRPFILLTGDPYVGTRVYWCVLLGVSTGALLWTATSLATDRAHVAALSLFLLAGQPTLFAMPGIAYADCLVMAVLTVATALVIARIAAGVELGARDAVLLGALFFVGIKAKETALPLLVLAALLFIDPSGRLRGDRAAWRRAGYWLGGAVLAQVALMGLDGLVLGDPLFSLRRSSWQAVISYNTAPFTYRPAEFSWLGLLLRPQCFVAFALYAGVGGAWAASERDRRLLVVYAVPAIFVLQLILLRPFAIVTITERYLLGMLPIVCLLAGLAYVRLLRRFEDERMRAVAPAPLALVLCGLLAVVLGRSPDGSLFSAEEMRLHVEPVLILVGFAALIALPWRLRLASALLTACIVAGGMFAIAHVVARLNSRDVQEMGEARFAGFYEVARAVDIERDAVVAVSANLYDRGIRPGVVPFLTRMNFNVPLRTRPIVADTWPVAAADYAVVTAAEYRHWAEQPDADPRRAIVSDDGEVALLCLRRACPRRQ